MCGIVCISSVWQNKRVCDWEKLTRKSAPQINNNNYLRKGWKVFFKNLKFQSLQIQVTITSVFKNILYGNCVATTIIYRVSLKMFDVLQGMTDLFGNYFLRHPLYRCRRIRVVVTLTVSSCSHQILSSLLSRGKYFLFILIFSKIFSN